MYISKVSIKNFRSLKNVTVKLNETNIIIGPNNAGKTSFFEAINFAIGWNFNRTPEEDDFYVECNQNFDPKKSEPIEIILELREGFNDRFSENIEDDFQGVIQFDEDAVKEGLEPIKYIRLQYTCQYSNEKNRFIESRKFLDQNYNELTGQNTNVRRENHLSYFPFFYLETFRDIQKEIRNTSSFWGRIKKSIDYTEKEAEVKRLMEELDDLIIHSEDKLADVVKRLKEIEHSIKISDEEDNISLAAFSTRTWELLDGLKIFLKTADSNISLPIEKHGMGTQNIAIFTIFNTYLDLLLPNIIENEEVTPIIGIEEPEAHIYPHSQRAIFEQLTQINGQKIISTHSPYIVDQANINDFILFRAMNGETKINQVPLHKKPLPYGLSDIAYEKNLFLSQEDIHTLKRYIQFKNTELLFSSLFLLCEGDSEKIFFEIIGKSYFKQSLGRLGISVVSCDGKNYNPFLNIARKDAFNLPWLIFSDGEEDTRDEVQNQVLNNEYDETYLDNITFLPSGDDFESFFIREYTSIYEEIIAEKFGETRLANYKQNQEKQNGKTFSTEEIINKFIGKKRKTIFAEYLAEYIIKYEVDLPNIIKDQFEKIKTILNL
ncbi:AAA family ATPase [Globicatella sulfidifaciens]|uniref:AAA family ATPase n=1 Tax=Globicatella sulfidifaciens TaxID=136093 RepID=A0A7X8C5V6_9LACT|nr:AAA family ATPase [Globicatella sulfidifaciens]NLJ19448.1 AAA family ATPase [Globicatella sulfidifaciens]